MYIPSPWHATTDCNPSMNPRRCKFDLEVPETPDYQCSKTPTGQWPGGYGGCSRDASAYKWFTNHTSVQEKTLTPKTMYDKWSWKRRGGLLTPWNSPGAAPVVGNGCGVNGGNPDGCDGLGKL